MTSTKTESPGGGDRGALGKTTALLAEQPSLPQTQQQTQESLKGWRTTLPVHPAADLPMMSEAELRELGEDIKKNGLKVPVVIIYEGDRASRTDLNDHTKYSLLDGRNRLDAMEAAGVDFDFVFKKGKADYGWRLVSNEISLPPVPVCIRFNVFDPYTAVASLNVHRRHLTPEKKREIIAALLKAEPTKSDRAIAKQANTHHHAVAKVRQEEEERGNISHFEVRTDTKGRNQPAKKKQRRTPDDLRRDIVDARRRETVPANADAFLRHAKTLKGIYDVGMRNGTFPPDLAPPFELQEQPATESDRSRAETKLPPDSDPLIAAWDKAGPKQRHDFVLARKVEIMRVQQEIGKSAFDSPADDGLDIPASLRREATS
jgi:hypothetical protein